MSDGTLPAAIACSRRQCSSLKRFHTGLESGRGYSYRQSVSVLMGSDLQHPIGRKIRDFSDLMACSIIVVFFIRAILLQII